jgi:Uma2 family endonuclease
MEFEIKEPAPKYAYISPEEYFEMDKIPKNRLEYYDGHVIELDAVSWQHDIIEHNVSRRLGNFLEDMGCRVMGPNTRVGTASEKSYMYPDILVLCEEMILKHKSSALLNPAIIMEVVSPSTKAIDKKVKRKYYEEIPTLQEYFMLDSQKREVTVLRKQSGNEWGSEEIIIGTNNLLIKTIDYQLTLPEIYKDTGL